MARVRMVTRTVVSTVFTVMVVNNETKTVENEVVIIPSADNMTEKALDTAIRNDIPEGKLFVQVVSSEKTETLYGMTEEEFIRHATVLPPRTAAEQ